MLKIQHLTSRDYRTMPWKNHRGKTSEIAVFPEKSDFHTDPFLWRVSTARLSSSGTFSQFPGYDRVITLIEGEQIELNHDCKDVPEIVRTFEPHQFKGEWMTTCEIEKTARDFNLMVRRGKVRWKFDVIDSSQTRMLNSQERWIVAFCAAGEVELGINDKPSIPLVLKDAVLIENTEQESVSLTPKNKNGDSKIILIQLSPLTG